MNTAAEKLRTAKRAGQRGSAAGPATEMVALESNTPFYLYLAFTVCQFLSLPNHIKALGVFRPSLLLMLLVTVCLIMNREQLSGRMNSDINKRIYAVLIYITLSLPFVLFPGSVIKNNLDLFVRSITFFFFTVLIIDSDKRLRTFVTVFIACQVIRVVDPVRLHMTEGYWGSNTHLGHGEFMNRLSSAPWDTVNPNGYAFIIVTAFIFAHYLMFGSRSKLLKITYLALVPVMLYALVLTSSRSGMIAFVIGFAGIFYHSRRRAVLAILAVIAVGAITANLSGERSERYLSLVRSDVRGADTAEGRFKGMETEFLVFTEHPIFGAGLGTSAEARFHATGKHRIAHNMYTEALIELGIIGFALFVGVLIAIYRLARQTLREIKKSGLDRATGEQALYYIQLGRALQTWFLMCLVFSIAHYGISEPWWYLFAGLITVWARCVKASVGAMPALATNAR